MTKKPSIAPRRPPDARTLEAKSRFVADVHEETFERSNVETSKSSKSVVRRKDGRQLKRMTVYLPVDLARRLAFHCVESDRDVSGAVALAISRHLEAPE